MRILVTISIAFTLSISFLYAQQSDSISKADRLNIAGYIKQLSISSFNKDFSDNITGGLIHNRINLKWKSSSHVLIVAEFRNRLFWGEQIKIDPDFSQQLRPANNRWDLENKWIDSRALLAHTNTERLYIDLKQKKWNLRVGRQRVNWGMTTTWNPNDIFNAYNFLDVDYEERPGVDGAKLQYQINDLSNIEIVHALVNNRKNITAVRYFVNKDKFDLQITAGRYRDRTAIGAGWAGSIGDIGFKGESQYFLKTNALRGHINTAVEFDYVFPKGWYTNLGVLHNSIGIDTSIRDFRLVDLKLSAENPMPAKYSIIGAFVKEINPLSKATLSMIYSPGMNMMILMNNISYNLCTNLDVDLLWQSFFAEINNTFQAAQHYTFIRFKWSY